MVRGTQKIASFVSKIMKVSLYTFLYTKIQAICFNNDERLILVTPNLCYFSSRTRVFAEIISCRDPGNDLETHKVPS